MIWFRDLLLGVFTRHLTTKLLALLLSLGLFGFVQASLRTTQEIRLLTLRFTLVPQLRNEFVLLSDEITFTNLLISGMRSKVDPLAKLYRSDAGVNVPIDRTFLRIYGEGTEKIRIRITRDLFADDRLFGRDITVGEFAEPVLELDKLVAREARVEIDGSQMPATINVEDHEYEGTRLNASVNVKSVTLEGPASAFTGDPVALVWVDKVADALSKEAPIQGERGEVKLSRVEVRWRGIATDLLPRVRVTLGGDQIGVNEFRRRLVVSCDVTKKKVQKTLQDVPIDIRYPLPREFDLVKDYAVDGTTFLDTDLRDGRKQVLEVLMPRSVAGNQGFIDNLVLVLNVGAATEDPATAGLLNVPYRLELKDPAREGGEGDVAALALVLILPPGSTSAVPQALAEFRRK